MSNEKKDSFIKDGLSLDETKTSTLMITYVICFIVVLAFFVKTGNGEALKTIFFANIGAVTGLNVTHTVSKAFNNNNKDNDDNTPKG